MGLNLKAELLEAIAGKNRGLLTTEIDRINILTLIDQLEDHNPTPQPLQATHLLEGNWRLLYTTSRSILGIDRLPLSQLGQIYQYICMNSQRIYNIAEILTNPFLDSLITVSAKYTPVSEKRVQVRFDRTIIGLKKLLNYRTPNSFIQELENGKKHFPFDFFFTQKESNAWLDTTYLDEDLRIGKGNEGNVFILTKK